MTRKTPVLFRYPGGKFYAIKLLSKFWESIEHDEYREPFVGGGSVFFSKSKSKFNWLNDLDSELIDTYKIISNTSTRLNLADSYKNEVANKERWREVFNSQPSNQFETAWKYYYLNRTSFSGKLVSPSWGYRPKRSLPPNRWHERILPCGEKLNNVKLTSIDFEKVILNKSKNNVLIFVDPPYFKPPKHKHYRNGFDIHDHERLAETLKKTPHKFFLTYDDCEEIRLLYNWANIYEVNFFYRVDNSNVENGRRKLGFELIITNYNIPKQETLFNE
ncbi:DNA adenine methylase [Celeribacter sp.]|uniref:DNA adenine methylase n=1 Tax=Celeribacter sp. TaxID=1890673 RepID=UPI003A8F5CB0